MTPVARALARLGRLGWSLTVCRRRAKAPLVPGWQHLTPADVVDLLRRHPQANLAALPAPSGLVVVDLDGDEARIRAQELGLSRDQAAICVTSRGLHVYFRRPPDVPARIVKREGIEVRAPA